MNIRVFIAAIILGAFFSCNKKNRIANEIESLFNHKITFITGYNELRCNSNIALDSLIKKDIKVISYINEMPCSSCGIKMLKLWQRKIKEIDENIAYITVVYSDNQSFVNMLDTLSLDFPLMHYDSKIFSEVNNLEGLLAQNRTFLLNKHNEVVLVGEPFGMNNLSRLYKKCIDSLSVSYNTSNN